jgi:hypothetical protein
MVIILLLLYDNCVFTTQKYTQNNSLKLTIVEFLANFGQFFSKLISRFLFLLWASPALRAGRAATGSLFAHTRSTRAHKVGASTAGTAFGSPPHLSRN